MEQSSVLRRVVAVIAVTLVILVSAGCQPSAPASEGGAPPANTPGTLEESRISPSEMSVTPAAAAETAPLPIPTAGSKEGQEMPESREFPEEVPLARSESERMIALAKADLVRRSGVPETTIVVRSVEEVVWPDTSLGCPQPGLMYAQVLTPGFRVVLEAREEVYAYHTDRDQTSTLCEEVPWSGSPSQGIDSTVEDGWPNESLDPDLIIVPPPKRK